VDYFEGTRKTKRRDAAITAVLLLIAIFLFLLPGSYQAPVRQTVRGTALVPFLAVQSQLVERRGRRGDVGEMRAQRDSLAAVVAAQATLAEENRRLLALLGLRSRAESSFRPARVLRLGVSGAESSFLIDIGEAQGVEVGSPMLASGGLIGVVWEVDSRSAHAIDWTHPDFRASAMTRDGEVYGLLEPRRGQFREEDMMVLTGAPFHSDIRPGTQIVTSGRGNIYPRGIPLGTVVGIDEADTGWRKSYLVRPAVRPESATHVLVGVRMDQGGAGDLSQLWHVPAAPDTIAASPASDGGAEQDTTNQERR